MDGTGFAGNDCPPDLDLSALSPLTATAGETFSVNLISLGATTTDPVTGGGTSGDTLRFLLDPDVGTDTPEGASISEGGLFTWTPTNDQVGNHTITVILVDAGDPVLADAETFEIEVLQGADPNAPTVDANGALSGTNFAASFTEDNGPTSIVAADLTVTDPDDNMVDQAVIQIANVLNSGQEFLDVTESGNVTKTYDDTTGTLVLIGEDTVETYQNILRTLTYDNLSQDPDIVTRVVEIQVFDGMNASATVSSTITMQAVNDAPDLEPIVEQTAFVDTEMMVMVTATDVEGDDLTFTLDAQSPATATIEKTGDTTAVIRWTPTAGDGPGPFTFVVLVTDDGQGELADSETFMVTLDSLLSPPTVDLNGAGTGVDSDANFEEGGDPVLIAPDGTVSDAEGDDITQMVVMITNLQDSGSEFLELNPTGGLSANYDAATGTLTISGTAAASVYESNLRNITYRNDSSDPVTTARMITVVASDSTGAGVVATANVSIQAVNDDPNLTLPAPFDDDQTAVEVNTGDDINFTAAATDADNTAAELTYALDLDGSGIPEGAAQPTIDPETGELSWTPDASGCFEVTVIVTDPDGGADQETFLVLVNEVANAPQPGTDPGTSDPGTSNPGTTDPGTTTDDPTSAAGLLAENDASGGNQNNMASSQVALTVDAAAADVMMADLATVDYASSSSTSSTGVVSALAAYEADRLVESLRDSGDFVALDANTDSALA